jgi:hypothetical protein
MSKSRIPAIDALKLLFRPVARILLKAGMNWKQVAEACKAVYVDVATREFGVRGRPTNVSRVAIMTGLTRRDVSRIRKELDSAEPRSETPMNRATRVLSGWHQDEDFIDPDGGPRRLSETGESASFEALCRRYCPDVPYTTMLKELRHVGAVTEEGDGRLAVKMRTYIPVLADPEQMLRSGSVLEDMGDTVAYNLHRREADPSRFERRATNTRIPAAVVPEFRDFVEAEGQAFLERVDAWLSEHEASDEDAKTVRLGLGTYWIQNDDTD